MGEPGLRRGAATAIAVMAMGCLWHVAPVATSGLIVTIAAVGLAGLLRIQRRVDARLVDAIGRRLCELDVLVVPGAVGACTVGPLRPTIVIGGATLARLDADEVRAVVHHERAHQRRWDPLWDALALDVGTRRARRITAREIRADVAALRAGVPRAALASALLKVPDGAAGVGFTPASEQRVRVLLGDDVPTRRVPIVAPLLGAVMGAVACLWTGHHLVMVLL